MNDFHFSEVYRSVNYTGSRAKLMNPKADHVNFASDVVNTSIDIRKIRFIAYTFVFTFVLIKRSMKKIIKALKLKQ